MKKEEKFTYILWGLLLCASPFLKFTLPLGGKAAALSCFSIVLPLVFCLGSKKFSNPLFGGVWAVATLFTLPITAGMPTLLAGLSWKSSITAGMPTLLAGLSWKSSKEKGLFSALMHVALPICCMALFIAHPSGGAAWTYTLYWLIPIICYALPAALLTRAMQSTFTAHAVGSVMWAYLVPTTSATWLSLIPVVALERALALSFAMVVVTAIKKAATLLAQKESLVTVRR